MISGDRWLRSNGKTLGAEDIRHHVSGILSGMFSLGGHPDEAMVEALIEIDPVFSAISFQGVPDIRVIIFKGYPVLAMTRLPTQASGGCANLHQGAIGVGIDIASGVTCRGTWSTEVIEQHPDTGADVAGFTVPFWDGILTMAAACHEIIGLGYLGADIVIDKNLGPMILELNARPGLAIQIANQKGLHGRLQSVESLESVHESAEERVAASRKLFAA